MAGLQVSAPSWWADAVVYQVYIRSFADSDGDGVGDLAGVVGRLPYLAALGVDALWLTPFYRSPMADHGYDIVDQCDVDPLFGTLADADALLAEAHRLGLRVIVDLVPNHTSDEHRWFVEAVADPASPLRDRYLFRPGRGDGPPNTWPSVFGGSAWTQVADGQWYLHLFDRKQPDLDWRHPAVHEEWERILRFWLDRGVDGFRVDVAHGLYKQADLADHPPGGDADGVMFHDMPNAWDQPEVVDVYRRWREITDGYDDRVLVGEVFLPQVEQVRRFVGRDRLHQSFNFPLLAAPFDARTWRALITASLDAFHVDGAAPTGVLSTHDVVRHATRFGGGDVGRGRARAATLALLALPGSHYLYEGEELGLEQDDVPHELRQDPIFVRSGGAVLGRDGCRTPVPWSGERPGHGFTTGTPWLPLGPQATERCVAAQERDPASTLALYRRALQLRRQDRGRLGDVQWIDSSTNVLAFQRPHADGGSLVCVLNTGAATGVVGVGGELVIASGPGVEAAADTLAVPGGTTAWLRTWG